MPVGNRLYYQFVCFCTAAPREEKVLWNDEILYVCLSVHMYAPLAGPQPLLGRPLIPLAGPQTPCAGPQTLSAGLQTPPASPQIPLAGIRPLLLDF